MTCRTQVEAHSFQIGLKYYTKCIYYIKVKIVQQIEINERRHQWNKDRNGNMWPIYYGKKFSVKSII